MLERAIELLPATRLPAFIEGYATPSELTMSPASPSTLLPRVRRFHEDSLAGKYWEGFNVNSKNFMQQSRGTMNWIDACGRHMAAAVDAVGVGDPLQTRTAFELLFSMLAELDTGSDRIIFFADEGGSWQVGIDWDRVIPAWCDVMAATSDADEYATSARSVIGAFVLYKALPLLAEALDRARPDQRAALEALPPPGRGPEPPFLATLV